MKQKLSKEIAEKLILFNSRPGMFVSEVNRDNVVSFIHGLELGLGESTISLLISQRLNHLKIVQTATGWEGQVAIYAESNALDWVSTYVEISTPIYKKTIKDHELPQSFLNVHGKQACGRCYNCIETGYDPDACLDLR